MGVVASPVSHQSNSPETISAENLEEIRHNLFADGWHTTSATFEPIAEEATIERIRVRGDIENDDSFPKSSVELRSFLVKSEEGDILRVVRNDSFAKGHQSGPANQSFSGSIVVHFMADLVLYATYSTDQYIDENGLRPVINEIKDRRWFIIITCALITTYCQVCGC